MVTQFEKYLVKSNLAKNTVTSYLWTMKYFLDNYKEVNKKNLLAYKGYLMENFKPQTVNLRLQAMNKYLEFSRLYIPKKLCTEAQRWLTGQNITSGYLFTNRLGNRLSTRGIAIQLKYFAEKYGLNRNVVYPHSFRHRFAKNFLDRFNDIALLADLMGHESIETTRIYLRRTASEQQKIVDKVVTW